MPQPEPPTHVVSIEGTQRESRISKDSHSETEAARFFRRTAADHRFRLTSPPYSPHAAKSSHTALPLGTDRLSVVLAGRARTIHLRRPFVHTRAIPRQAQSGAAHFSDYFPSARR